MAHGDVTKYDENEVVQQNMFGKAASRVDALFAKHFYRVGLFVGTRPCASIALSLLWCIVCFTGMPLWFEAETRGDKLWIPQDTDAQADQAAYNSYFPPNTRMQNIILEGKNDANVLNKDFLLAAMKLHQQVDSVKSKKGDTLRDLCVLTYRSGHPCMINSILSFWAFNETTLKADTNVLATINAQGRTQDDMRRLLGKAAFAADGKVTGAKAMALMYILRNVRDGPSDYRGVRGEEWEDSFLKGLKCDEAKCDDDDVCKCGFASDQYNLYVTAMRSMSDVFGAVIQGDVMLINLAFLVMIIYLLVNLGGFCHKFRQRALLAMGCVLTIVMSGVSGYGLAMWFQFPYTPVMSVLPFVLLGIGVDDSFVIMNALDRVDSTLPVNERIAHAVSHAGVSILVTSLTDFVAFMISVTSALPALSAFCAYAALSVINLFILQVTMFAAFATFDTRRIEAKRIDCCPCCCPSKGCPCCPIDKEFDQASIEDGSADKDPNQLICSGKKRHQGGVIGLVLETKVMPILVKPPVAIGVISVAVIFTSICAWRTSQLEVEDALRKFIPDDSYVNTALTKQDLYFGTLGTSINIVTRGGDYFGMQSGITSIGARISAMDFMQPTTSDAYSSWAESYKAALKQGSSAVGATVAADANGIATDKTQYYAGLDVWLKGNGKRFAKDVIWVDSKNPQSGIKASRIMAEIKPFNKIVDDKLQINTGKAVEVMDLLREKTASWSDVPGCFAYTYNFLSWEVYRIIKKEMFLNVALCMIAVFLLTLMLIAHPGTSSLVFICVAMTIVDILGCMNMWGLAIDNVSVIQLVIAVGLSVDYAAHVGHSFMTKVGTNQERAISTMGDVGSAVLNGGVSTFLAVLLLAGSKSYVFRVLFQTFFLTVVLGLAHGMLVLPALLSLIGPAGYAGRAVTLKAEPDTIGKGEATE
eukprot:TRINITY_DN26483_c0_g1_i1.p1 TRINITY_DN26483_c0_g1~~TRINITY_DN26483_c0_g1_i1.p1  ORF type:complete len:927 (+),score=196.51 TRINITY_DN26483_c0_g1_i1:71-2851(+)